MQGSFSPILDYDVVMNFDCQCGAKDIYQIVEDLERTFSSSRNCLTIIMEEGSDL